MDQTIDFTTWALCLPRWLLRCHTKLSWHLAKSFTAARQDQNLPTMTFPLPAPHIGCFAAGSGSKLSKRRLLKLARQRLLHVIVVCLNYVYLGRPASQVELGRRPNAWQTRCLDHLRALLVVCGDGRELFPMVPGRSGPELGAIFFQLENFASKHPELGKGYFQHEPKIFAEDKNLISVKDHPELQPYKNLDPSRLRLTGDGRWPLEDFLDGPLWLPFLEPKFLMHGQSTSGADLPNFKFESRERNLELCKLWDAKGLLRLYRLPLTEGHFSRVFNAHKSKEVDRQIGDRRIPNARERSIDGPSSQLPPGFLLTNLQLDPFREKLRASITDRRDYYHQVRVTSSRAQSNMLPFCFSEDELTGLCALDFARAAEKDQPKRPRRGFDTGDGFGHFGTTAPQKGGWYPAFGSLFQGDHLGVEFALAAHEGLLLGADLLQPSNRILGHVPFPANKKFEALIIDDYFAIGVEPRDADPLNSFAASALARARQAYEENHLPGSVEKDIEAADKFKAAGAEIDSSDLAIGLGLTTVGSPLSKRIALSALSLRAARLSSTSAKLLSRLAGNWTSVLLYRRCMTCVVDDMFRLAAEAERLGENMVVHLPRKVAEELSILAALAPVLVSNIAGKYATKAFASDASLSKGAVVSTVVDEKVSKVLWLGSDKRGGYTKLDEAPQATLAALGFELACDLRAQDDHGASPTVERPLLLYFDFVEFFGGSGRVSAAAAALGLVVAPPLDLDASPHYNLGQPRLLEWAFHMIETGRFRSFMTEPPCTTFSPAAHPALRGYDQPVGYDPSNEKTKQGTLLAFRSFLLLRHGRRYGRPCGKEQPRLSKMAWLSAWMQLILLGFQESVIASCQFGSPHKKEFRFLSHGLDAASLEVRCPGGHQHVRIEGAYTKASAVYTFDLARHFATHFARALSKLAFISEDVKVEGYESVLVNDVLAANKWETEKCWSWACKSHINVLEARAGHGILHGASWSLRSSCFACILDSRVAKGALSKGRSSARGLQRICKRAGPLQLVADLYPGWCFGPTRLNTADDPTRDQKVRAPVASSLSQAFGTEDLQKLHSVTFSRPAANFLRLTLLVLVFQSTEASFGMCEFDGGG